MSWMIIGMLILPMPVTEGKASYYTPRETSRITANQEEYTGQGNTCAFKTGKFNDYYIIIPTEANTQQLKVTCRCNDRGPYRHKRIIDLSKSAMQALQSVEKGVINVKIFKEPFITMFQRLVQ